jgi:hypothetical protein
VTFDPDALLAAIPCREMRRIADNVLIPTTRGRVVPTGSALGEVEEYNGFSKRERYRLADLSNWLASVGATKRPQSCDICGARAADEHAENYYDLTRWVGLCIRCHRNALHKRFENPARWHALVDANGLKEGHWARLVSMKPFDLAALMRSRGVFEPKREDFA